VGKPFRREQLLATIESCLGTGPALEPEAAPETPLFDRTVYGGLLETMGAETMNRLLDRLLGQLDGCLADQELSPDERNRLAKDVHGLVSAAGLLGFSALSAVCREVERACRGDGDLASALQRFREARAQTVRQIAALRSAA
jgi:HPt (histidine-containing phosphotransfer) domain-containing protein